MRKIITFVISVCILLAFGINSYADESVMCWYCVRSGKRQPSVTREERLVTSYGGITVDRSVNDSSDKRVIYLTFDAGYENGNTERIVNPIRLMWVNGFYYLVTMNICGFPSRPIYKNYRVDRMKDVVCLDIPAETASRIHRDVKLVDSMIAVCRERLEF